MVESIVAGGEKRFLGLLNRTPELARARFSQGASRREPQAFFLAEIGHYIFEGDTALHFAAAAYRIGIVKKLAESGAEVGAKNRRGTEPLHLAAVGRPGSGYWNPAAQVTTIAFLIEAGANPNAQNLDGATPLHRAVRTRCAEAVKALLDRGADPAIKNKNGSTAQQLAAGTTGRSGSGSPEAKAQQEAILELLKLIQARST
jgi:hypothetical protein